MSVKTNYYVLSAGPVWAFPMDAGDATTQGIWDANAVLFTEPFTGLWLLNEDVINDNAKNQWAIFIGDFSVTKPATWSLADHVENFDNRVLVDDSFGLFFVHANTNTIDGKIDTAIVKIGTIPADLGATAVPTSNTAHTWFDCLNGARAQAFGNWVVDASAKTLKLFANDGTTLIQTFNIAPDVTSPLTRTKV